RPVLRADRPGGALPGAAGRRCHDPCPAGEGRLGRQGHALPLCPGPAGALEPASDPGGPARRGAKNRSLREDRPGRLQARSLWRCRHGNLDSAGPVGTVAGEVRAGRKHRSGLPVRGDRERRPGLRGSLPGVCRRPHPARLGLGRAQPPAHATSTRRPAAQGRRRQRRRPGPVELPARRESPSPHPELRLRTLMPFTPEALQAIWLTLKLATLTTVFLLLLALPLAWWLAH